LSRKISLPIRKQKSPEKYLGCLKVEL